MSRCKSKTRHYFYLDRHGPGNYCVSREGFTRVVTLVRAVENSWNVFGNFQTSLITLDERIVETSPDLDVVHPFSNTHMWVCLSVSTAIDGAHAAPAESGGSPTRFSEPLFHVRDRARMPRARFVQFENNRLEYRPGMADGSLSLSALCELPLVREAHFSLYCANGSRTAQSKPKRWRRLATLASAA